jgi:hypothetical protein
MFGAGAVDTFMGLPRCRDLSRLPAKIALIGADGCTPYPSVGFYCAGGPAAIRAAGAAYAANLAHMNFDLGGPVFPGRRLGGGCGRPAAGRWRSGAANRARIAGRSARFWTGARCRS